MVTTDDTQPGLREIKKQETRQLISDRATTLFIQRGFEQTTISDVAHAARVAKKTVTNYFPRKEDLAFDQQEQFADSLEAAVRTRTPGQSALSALRENFNTALAERSPIAGFTGKPFTRMVSGSPTLTTALRNLHDQREARLAAALAETSSTAPVTVEVQIVASLLGAVHRVLFTRIQALVLAGASNDDIAATVSGEATAAFDLLEPALGHYATA